MDGKQQPSDDATWQFKPGETISPRTQGADTATASAGSQATATPVAPIAETASQPSPVPQPQGPVPQTPAPFVPDAADLGPSGYETPNESISWTASEFITHNKTAGWHFGLIAAAIILAVGLWFIFRDWVTAGVVVVAGVVLSLYGARRPGELQYQLDNYGISIGPKQFSFNDFRAFSLVPEGAFASIALLPTKRFAPMTTLYFDPEDSDRILEILGNHLPQQPTKADPIDALMRKIRF